jgi:mannose-1-phosphate guanylyltransferase
LKRWVVILAGGVGSRFWPLSTPSLPKQLLPLVTDKPLIADTLDRVSALAAPENTLILTNASLAEAVRDACPEIPRANVIAEPKPAGTAAALSWAAAEIERRDGSDAVMICVHADWAIADVEEFRNTLKVAAEAADNNRSLVTVGIVPTRPDPGLGYIEPGEKISERVSSVSRFVEKPDAARAERMIAGGALWNSGIFAWRVGDFLDEVRALTPEVAAALRKISAGDTGLQKFFAEVKSIAVDVGVLERSKKVQVVAGNFGWDDIGTWGALQRIRNADDLGNVINGDAFALESTHNVIHAKDQTVVLYGVTDLVVVAKDGLTLVTTVDKSAHLKNLLDALPKRVAEQ